MRRGLALAPVVAVVTAIAEIAVFVAVAHMIGAGWALLLLAVSCVAGLVLLRREGMKAWRRFRAATEAGTPPGSQVTDGLVGLLGALLLAVPGFVTAVLGLVLLVPPTRGLVRRNVERGIERQMSAAVVGDLFGPRRVRVKRGEPVPEHGPVVEEAVPVQHTPGAITGEVVEGEIVR
jgi:UPF0716 protein FxsA